jgi:serine/threonine protein kinase/DNA-binding response OmpR family regulator
MSAPEHSKSDDAQSRRELLDCLKESKLLTEAELERAEALAPGAGGKALGDALVQAGLLTSYQMEMVLGGKHEKLKIGNYVVLQKLGTGGTGTVYKAMHRKMKRIVALKVLARNLCKDKSFVQRFQREIETLAQLSHPNIVMAYDADEAKVGHYLVMEFVPGEDLASVVQKHGPMGVAEAVGCILQAARGLAYVHARKMIHRDMKPANLLRDADGVVKVTDLGLARTGRGALVNNSLTQAGGVLGTVDYMPPEQALDSTNLDQRCDIYSLGATLYFLLIGGPPYPGQTMMDTLLKHREAPIPSLIAARPDVPPALDELFQRMMAKTVEERVQWMGDVVCSLEMILSTLEGAPAMSLLLPGFVEDVKPERTHTDTMTVPQSLSNHTPKDAAAVLKVLLVEPSRTLARIIGKYLQEQEITHVLAVATGEEAINAVRTEPPNAIISAMHLADMTGVELAQHLRTESPAAVPGFVLISSESESAEVNGLTQCGQAVMLHKPFSREKLIDALSLVSGPLFKGRLNAASAELAPAKTRDSARILIVDDSAAARGHVRNVLTGLGVTQFVEAVDGAQAVAALTRDSYDLIVTDYNMPFMDGGGLVGYLKQNPATATLPIIMVTTETDPAKLNAVRKLGVAAICDKSFPPDVVGGVLDQLFAPLAA